MAEIQSKAEDIARLTRVFRDQQTIHGGEVTVKDKLALKSKLKELDRMLNRYLAEECGVDLDDNEAYEAWLKSHHPFHWFTEFYGILNIEAGFSVIVGNPPYARIPETLNRTLLRNTYSTALDKWSRDENLYALVFERSNEILQPILGRLGLILPLSISFSTKRSFELLRKYIEEQSGHWWWSHYDRIPSALFGNEVRTRCTISICVNAIEKLRHCTTSLKRWNAEARNHLFTNLYYTEFEGAIGIGIPKLDSQFQSDALHQLQMLNRPLGIELQNSIGFKTLEKAAPDFPQPCIFVGGTAYNWFPAWREIPATTKPNGTPSLPARTAGYKMKSNDMADIVFALLCSSMGYWWWAVASDGFNLKKWLIQRFPLSPSALDNDGREELANLGRKLRAELLTHYVYKDNRGRIGNFYLPACDSIIRQIDSALSKHVDILSDEFFEDIYGFNQIFSRLEENE